MSPHVFDPYGEHPEGVPDEVTVLAQFLWSVEDFLSNVFKEPPDSIRGEWLEEQREAWRDITERLGGTLGDRVIDWPANEIDVAGKLQDHGLTGPPLRAKINAWRDRTRAFFQLRNTRRLTRALQTGGVIVESIADCIPGVGGAYKEAIKGLNHLVDLAAQEGA